MENLKDTINEEKFDIKEFIYKMLGYWYLFVISIFMALVIVTFINKYKLPVYEINSTILIQPEKSMLDARFKYGFDIDNSYQLSNEIGILKSYTLTQRALKNLDFTVSYYQPGRFNNIELYKECPIKFIIDSASNQPLFTEIKITIVSPDEFEVEIENKNVLFYNFLAQRNVFSKEYYHTHFRGKINKKFLVDSFGGTVIPLSGSDLHDFVGRTYIIEIFNELHLISTYRNISVTGTKSSSILILSIQGNNIKKMADFLNSLSKEYLVKGLEKKNIVADNTIRFIDSQVGEVADSLYFSEKVLQEYRTNHSIMNVDFQSQQIFSLLENLQNQRAEVVVKQKYYEYLKNYLTMNKDGHDLVLPSSLGIQDAVLNNLVNELTDLYNEFTELSINSKRDNPYIISIESKIKNLRRTIQENIETLVNTTKITIQDIDQRIGEISARANKLPETERKLFGFERKFKLNDALYTYLLTKRSEVQIAKASYTPDNEILDIARENEYKLISPNKRKNLIIALLIGFFVPVAFIYMKDFFNDRIESNKDIEAVTNLPILGHIVRNVDKTYTVVVDNPLSLSSESLRAIRTNFQFVANENDKNVILFTSSMMNEGKTFTCLNLALSFALNNKKTLLINFDLRKPKINQYLGLDNNVGLSNYLSRNITLEEIIIKTQFENLDVIVSGTIPPNPMELLAGEQTEIMFSELRSKYDYILLDTPPVGMVADAYLLLKYSDVNVFIVRQNLTLKKVFSQLIRSIEKKNIKNVNIILNDVQVGRRYQVYSHGYMYGYGYGYLYKQMNKKGQVT